MAGERLPGGGFMTESIGSVVPAVAPHIVCHDPARALREVAAKRRIVERCVQRLTAGAPDYEPRVCTS